MGLALNCQKTDILKELVAMMFATSFQRAIMYQRSNSFVCVCVCVRARERERERDICKRLYFIFWPWLNHRGWKKSLRYSNSTLHFTDHKHFNDIPEAKNLGRGRSPELGFGFPGFQTRACPSQLYSIISAMVSLHLPVHKYIYLIRRMSCSHHSPLQEKWVCMIASKWKPQRSEF